MKKLSKPTKFKVSIILYLLSMTLLSFGHEDSIINENHSPRAQLTNEVEEKTNDPCETEQLTLHKIQVPNTPNKQKAKSN